MELTEDEIKQKYAKQCRHCNKNTVLPYEYEFTCFSCDYNVIKRKNQLSKIQRKTITFLNRLKYAEQKIFCICIDADKTYESSDYEKIYEILSTLKNEKIKNKQYLNREI